jgi:ABC-type multidrug transport system fused ATPase/permease subunit
MKAASRKNNNSLLHSHLETRKQKYTKKWQTFVKYLGYYSSFSKFHFWRGIILAFIRAPIDSSFIFVAGLFIDSIVDYYQDAQDLNLGFIQLPSPFMYVFLMLTLWVIRRVLDALIHHSRMILQYRSWSGHRQDVVEKFRKLNLQELDAEDIKDEIEKIQGFWWGRATAFYDRMVSVGELLISISVAFYAVFTFNPWLGLIILVLPIPEAFIIYKNNNRFRTFVDDVASLALGRSYIFNILIDTRTFTERKINSMYLYMEQKMKAINNALADGYIHVMERNEVAVTIASVVDMILVYGVRIAIVFLGLLNQVPVGRITYVLGYVETLYDRMFRVQSSLILLFDDLSFIEKLFDLLEVKGFADYKKGGKRLKKGTPAIEFKDFTFTFRDTGITVMKNVNLSIMPGEKIMVLGKDGSGKSSLMKLIASMYKVQSGQLLLDGIPVDKLARGVVKNKLSLVAEDFGRYYMSLKENITIGDNQKPFDKKLFEKVLEVTGLDTWVKEVNLDIENTTVGSFFEGSLEISSGHWQRITIARALYRNRDIFIFDQPFTYVDKASVNEIFPRIMEFIGNRTLIFIGEEIVFPEYFNAFYEMGSGQIKKIDKVTRARKWIEA